MAEIAVSLAREKLLLLLQDEANLLMGVPKEFEDIKDELESIQVFLKDADKKAAAEDDSTSDGIKKWVKRLREQAFHIEDVIDEYMIYVGQNPRDPGCEALLCDIAHFIKTLIPRHRIAYEIRNIKSYVCKIKEESASFGFRMERSFEKGSTSSSKNKKAFEWIKFNQILSSKLEKESRLTEITNFLGLSYDDFPDNLKPCLLYFGIYPKDHAIKSKKLIRQWVAEGFVTSEKGKTLEEVAEQYLSDLISRNLVQVSSTTLDGKARSCRVHDLLHDMILKKFKDLSFCQCIVEDDQSVSGVIRRLSIASNFDDLMATTESSHIRSLLVFRGKKLHPDFLRKMPTKYKSLKLLDYESDMNWYNIPENFRDLIHLKYLSFRGTTLVPLCFHPEIFIAKFQNLETLDLRVQSEYGALNYGVPKGVSKLRKLRHLLGRMLSTQLKEGIGGMTSLQTLRDVEIDDDGVELFTELGKLKQLRELGLVGVMKESGRALCNSINEMQNLKKLCIASVGDVYGDKWEVLDLHFVSPPPPMLRKLRLEGKLYKLPEWIPELQNLISLFLKYCDLTDDALKSLQHMPNLLSLYVGWNGYRGESLHFQDGGFQKLKELHLQNLYNLNSIFIHKGALHSLNKLRLSSIPQLNRVPSSIHYLEKLQVLLFECMSAEFEHNIKIGGGQEHPVFKHVPFVKVIGYDEYQSILLGI